MSSKNVIVGNTGPVSTGGASNFAFAQLMPSAAWSITHDLGGFPSVILVDPLGNLMIAGIRYVDRNQVIATFSEPMSGAAYLSM